MFPRTHLLATAALTLLNAGAPSASAQSTSAQTTTVTATPEATFLRSLNNRNPELVRAYVQMRGQQAQPESDSEPETMRADPLLAPIVLPQTLATLDQAISTAPTAMVGALQAARRGFAEAQEKLHAGSRDASPLFMVGVMQAMAQGQAAMGDALDMALAMQPAQVTLLLPAVQKVREAARRHSRAMAFIALSAGVPDGRLEPAMAALRDGDARHAAGDDGGAVSQYALGFGLAANTVVFSMDRYEQNLRSVFDTQTVGWSYAITQAGQLVRHGDEGQARTGADLPATAQASTRKMHMASVSKTITAILMQRLLTERGLSADSAIGPHLPAGWARGTGVNSISFRQLMTHRSGFGQNAPGGNKAGYLGFMNPVDNYDYAQGNFGVYHTHGGDWDHTGWGGLDACVMVYPINVEAAVLINSSRKGTGSSYSSGGYQCRVMKWAFETAWVAN